MRNMRNSSVPIRSFGPAGAGVNRDISVWHRLRDNSASIWRRSVPPSGLSTVEAFLLGRRVLFRLGELDQL